jgi:putative phosphoesterase
MKILFISDIHGVPSTLKAALEKGEEYGFDKLVLLGDLMYHGPRNGVPDFYDPVKVAELLNTYKDKIVAVRGNCDAEVDQMLLEFPMMDDYAVIEADGEKFFLTHGHLYNEQKLPPIGMGTVLVHGLTHIAENKLLECGLRIFNPGSVSLPKGGQPRQFGYWDGMSFRHMKVSFAHN